LAAWTVVGRSVARLVGNFSDGVATMKACGLKRRVGCALGWVAGFVLLGGCVPQDRAPVPGGANPAETGFQIPVDQTLLTEGRHTYAIYCKGCHGENGDGKGPAERVLHPKPRNFVTADFKFNSRRSGQLPTDQDLFDTITRGLTGSSMPSWKLLPERQRWALVAYIKTFSPKWEEFDPAPTVPVVEDPYAVDEDKSRAIARGEAVFHGLAQCWTCHPAFVSPEKIQAYQEMMEIPPTQEFREDLHRAVARLSSEDQVVFVPDFRRDRLRAGNDVRVLYRSIAAGVTGTAMPTWVDSIQMKSEQSDGYVTTRGDLWAIAYYVHSLTMQRPRLLSEPVVVRANRALDVSQGDWQPLIGAELRAMRSGSDVEQEGWDDEDDEDDQG